MTEFEREVKFPFFDFFYLMEMLVLHGAVTFKTATLFMRDYFT